ncbi:MAG: TetR/AcrR family transcriptional regulator [Planctomycetota bacterium]
MNTDPQKHRSGPMRSETAHQAILDAAAALITESGYLGVSMQHIAKRAGVGKQTVYRWWPSKAALYMELYVSLSEAHIQPVDTGSLENDLKKLWRQLCKMFRRTAAGPAFAGLIAEAQTSSEAAQEFRENFLNERREGMFSVIQRGIDRGELPADTDVALLTDMIAGPVFYRLLAEHAPLSESFVDRLINSVMNGTRA